MEDAKQFVAQFFNNMMRHKQFAIGTMFFDETNSRPRTTSTS